jgi:predicted deacylase
LAVIVIVAVAAVVMVPAVAAKLVVALPAATVTEAGTDTALLLSEIVTTCPPDSAALLSVTVQVAVAPDSSEVGVQLRLEGTGGATSASEALADVPLRPAVSTAVPSAATWDAETANVALEAPATTLTDAGVVTTALSSANTTRLPPAGAALFSVTVQVAVAPEAKLAGAHTSDVTCATALRLIEDVVELEPYVAVMTAD